MDGVAEDYIISILYHLNNMNVVADFLSQKVVSMGSLDSILVSER